MERSGCPYFSHKRLDPSARSLPNPSPLTTASTMLVSASAEPNLSGRPPVCSSVMAPISYSSMAAASVEPKVMGSMPCSLQIKLA